MDRPDRTGQLSPILMNLNVAVYRTENKSGGRIIEVNPAFLEIFGFKSMEEVLGLQAVDLYANQKDRDSMREIIQDKGALKATEFSLKRKNGEVFPGKVSSVVVQDPGSGESYIDGVVEDMGEYKDLVQELEQKTQALEDEQRLFYSGPVVLIQWPVDGKDPLEHVSANVQDVLGYEADELLTGQILYADLVHPEDLPELLDHIAQAVNDEHEFTRPKPYRIRKQDGEYIWIQDFANIVRDENGIPSMFIGYIYDITETYRALEKVQESESRYRSLVENSPTGILRIGLEGNILDVNQQMVDILGSPSAEATKQFNIFDFKPLQTAGISQRFQECLKEQKIVTFKGQYRSAWGKDVHFATVINPISNAEGHVIGAQANMEDITEAHLAREEKRKIEKQQLEERNSFVSAPIMIFKWRVTGKEPVEYATENVKQILGYSREELESGKPVFTDIIHPEDVKRVHKLARDMIDAGETRFTTAPYRLRRKDGEFIWVNDYSTIFRNPDGSARSITGIVYDITESIKAEETIKATESTYQEIFNSTLEAILIHDADDYSLVDVNDAMLKLFGYSYEEALKLPISAISADEYTQKKAIEKLELARSQGPQNFEWHSKTATGKTFWSEVNLRMATIYGQTRFLVSIRDISERKEMEEQLRANLKEQDVLTREVHHRVKNNMQVINSILNLQSDYSKDPKLTTILDETQNRVRSMGLIHEKLFKSKSMAQVEFDNYLRSLIREVINFYSDDARKVKFVETIEPLHIEITKAIPCGLIINELITNSLKYAFPDDREGTVWVDLSAVGENLASVTIRDDGVGIPGDVDFETTPTMGLRIVRILAEQLNAEMQIEVGEGTSFRFMFELTTAS